MATPVGNQNMTTTPHQGLLDDFLGHLRAEVAPKTYRLYAQVLTAAQRQLPHGVVVANEAELRGWIWRDGLSPHTIAAYGAAVRRLHRWLHERHISDYDPAMLLPKPRLPRLLPRPVPAEQLQAILTEARDPVRVWCLIAVYTGARCCELAALDRGDITEQTTRLYGKGSLERVVPTHPLVWAAAQTLPAGPVAPIGSADPAKRISDRIARECRRVGPGWRPRVTAHRLRHTIATEVLHRTGNLRLVQDLLGHQSPATTAVYTRVTPGRMAAAVADLPDWGASGSADAAGRG